MFVFLPYLQIYAPTNTLQSDELSCNVKSIIDENMHQQTNPDRVSAACVMSLFISFFCSVVLAGTIYIIQD